MPTLVPPNFRSILLNHKTGVKTFVATSKNEIVQTTPFLFLNKKHFLKQPRVIGNHKKVFVVLGVTEVLLFFLFFLSCYMNFDKISWIYSTCLFW